MTQPVLEIEDLHLSFPGYKADVHALNHVSLHINRGEIVGVVGESGSGKSVTAMLTMRLLPEGSYRIHQDAFHCWVKMCSTPVRNKCANGAAHASR